MKLFSPALFLHYLVSAQFAAAALTTLWLSLTALLLGMTIGMLLALGRAARFRAIREFVTFYLWLFRGTPVLLQLVFAFNVLPSFGIVLSGFNLVRVCCRLASTKALIWPRSCAPGCWASAAARGWRRERSEWMSFASWSGW